MNGYCSLCDEWREDVKECRICGDVVGLCCYSQELQCCDACEMGDVIGGSEEDE